MSKNKKYLLLLILTITTSLLSLDIGSKLITCPKIDFVNITFISPYIFTISYTILILTIIFINKKIGKIIYLITMIFFNIYTLAQILHFKILDRIFTFTDILVANQATGYTKYALEKVDLPTLLTLLISIIFIIISIKLINKAKITINKNKKIKISILLIVLTILTHSLGVTLLGKQVSDDAYNFWTTPRNVYNDYNNPSNAYSVSGIYEYAFRDFYTYFRDLNKDTTNDIKEITAYVNNQNRKKENNNYTGIFKDKNLIMIMMESIDSWLINNDTMPTLVNLQNTGLNFTNRYSPTFGGGATINTEFSSLTGYYATVTKKPIYFYDKNNYDYSLPNLFKNNNYNVNSVHMNTGTFYNRSSFHKALGFTNHYAMKDLVKDVDFEDDTNLIKNDISYNHIIDKNNKFMTFITTYSPHVPYIDNDLCKSLDTTPFEIENDEETTCVRTLANVTDNFIKLLINRLQEDNLLDDTVIVLYTDHYTYGYSNTARWTNITDPKLSQHTTFTIWSKDIKHQNIDILCSTVDIPLTILNMFDIDYNPNLYIGTDIFSNYHEQIVYFNDYTWLTNKMYYQGKENYDITYIKEISNIVNKKIKINEKMITSDFYKYYN